MEFQLHSLNTEDSLEVFEQEQRIRRGVKIQTEERVEADPGGAEVGAWG